MVSSAPDLISRALHRERLVVAASVGLLALLSWLFVVGGAGISDGPSMAAMRPPLSALMIMWWVMMVAMMLPSAAPAILLYGRVRKIRNQNGAIAESWVFLLGYLAAWLAFALVAAGAQWLLAGSSMVLRGRWTAGAVLLAVGLYQLSPLKAACVRECRSPAEFFSRHWQRGRLGAVRLGVLHGAYCVGCCWMLMALLFVGGVMNILWIVALTVVVAVEKLAPRGPLFGRAIGIATIFWGLAKLLGY
jgi:predicted metal-binding membrane protein